MKYIVLFRHGPATDTVDWMHQGKADDQRPLTDEGIQVTQRASRGLKKVLNALGSNDGLILSSPYKRARQTADILKDTLQISREVCILDDLIPHCHPRVFASSLFSYTEPFLIAVGHQPHLSLLGQYLLTQGEKTLLLHIERAGSLGCS